MKSHRLYNNISDSLLQWDEIITMMSEYYQTISNYTFQPHEEEPRKFTCAQPSPESPNKLFKKGLLLENTLVLEDIAGAYPNRIQPLYDTINIKSFAQEKLNTGHNNEVTLYFSFLPEAHTHGIHRDTTDVFIWQQQGEMQIDVYDKQKYSYTLSPGDLIFIPEGMYHNTKPLTPRATLSFAFFRDTDDECNASDEYYQMNNVDTSQYTNPFNSIFNLN